MSSSLLPIEYFNFVGNFTKLSKLKNEINSVILSLPEYSQCVKKLGVFIAKKSDVSTPIKAMEYTTFRECKPWISPHGKLMMSFFYQGIQSIVILVEDYLKENDNDIKCTFFHEMGHAICDHKVKQVKSSIFSDKIPKEKANDIKNLLSNYQNDYEVDVFLVEKIPGILLDYLYNYSLSLSQNMITKLIANLPEYAQPFELTIYLIDFSKNLFVLNHLPNAFLSSRKFKKARKKFVILIKSVRLWLMEIMRIYLPPYEQLLTETDFKNQFKLKLWYCKTVEIDKKTLL